MTHKNIKYIVVFLIASFLIIYGTAYGNTTSSKGENKVFYYDNGNKRLETTIKDGHQHGIRKEYYESGSIKMEGIFINGIKEHIFIHYFPNGQVKSKMEYKNGTVDGVVKIYSKEGKLIQDEIWRNGKSPGWATLVKKSQRDFDTLINQAKTNDSFCNSNNDIKTCDNKAVKIIGEASKTHGNYPLNGGILYHSKLTHQVVKIENSPLTVVYSKSIILCKRNIEIIGELQIHQNDCSGQGRCMPIMYTILANEWKCLE